MAADYAIALASSRDFRYLPLYEQRYLCRHEPPDRSRVRDRAHPRRLAAAAPRAQI